MRSILIGLLLTPALWGQKTEWVVRYIAGPYRSAERQVVLQVEPDSLLLNREKVIPAEAITGLAYQRLPSRRSGTWVTEEDFQNADPKGHALLAAIVFTNDLFEIPPAYRHRIHLIWHDSEGTKRMTLESSKREYRGLLAALTQVTGRRWQEYYSAPPERHARAKITLDAAAKEAALLGVQASLGRHAPVPAHLALEK